MKFYVARDKNGVCCLYESYPSLKDGIWDNNGNPFYHVSPRLFPGVTFENSPEEVEIKFL
jgi:hypothetical protein